MKKLTYFVLAIVLVLAFAGTVPAQEPVKEEPVAPPKPEIVPAPEKGPGLFAVPANDLWANAITVAVPSSTAGTTNEATWDSTGVCGTDNTAPGVWYHVVGDGAIMGASTCSYATYDTKISVYRDNGATCVTGNDDSCGVQSQVYWPSQVGADYYILVHGYDSGVGDFTLTVTSQQPPSHDACAGALAVGAVPYVHDAYTVLATSAPDDPVMTCTNLRNNNTVWYVYTPGTSGQMTVSTAGSNYDTVLGIYTGSCGSLTQVACNDDYDSLQSLIADLPVTGGTTYYVEVADYGNPDGGSLHLSLDGPPLTLPMHVSAITGQPVLTRLGIELRAYVYVQDDASAPVPGATVAATLTAPGKAPANVTAVTGAGGQARFTGLSTRRGTWSLCVTNITAPGYVFVPGANDCKSWVY